MIYRMDNNNDITRETLDNTPQLSLLTSKPNFDYFLGEDGDYYIITYLSMSQARSRVLKHRKELEVKFG